MEQVFSVALQLRDFFPTDFEFSQANDTVGAILAFTGSLLAAAILDVFRNSQFRPSAVVFERTKERNETVTEQNEEPRQHIEGVVVL